MLIRSIIWWMVFGLLTWAMELVVLGLVTLSRFDQADYHKIGSEWIDDYFRSMIPKFMMKHLVLGNLWTTLCILVTWPFDRIVMYIHWRNVCKLYTSEKEGS